MVVQAEGGASVAATDPERAVEAFDAISASGREAMSEMRRVLGVLKDQSSDGALAPQPRLARVGDLVEGVRRSGLEVELQLEGRARPLAPGLDLSAHRILQRTGRIVTSAAVLVVVVFLGFMAGGFLSVKQAGLGLRLAVLLDATVVRMLLVPATMKLLGNWNWWAPESLRRLHERWDGCESPRLAPDEAHAGTERQSISVQ